MALPGKTVTDRMEDFLKILPDWAEKTKSLPLMVKTHKMIIMIILFIFVSPYVFFLRKKKSNNHAKTRTAVIGSFSLSTPKKNQIIEYLLQNFCRRRPGAP
jgi:hypothetical protein